MTKKRWLLAGCLIAFVGVVLSVLALLPPRTGVTKANFDRIEKGMTKVQIEGIFGRIGKVVREDVAVLAWEADDESSTYIRFLDDRMIDASWIQSKSNETFSDKLRRWLRL